MSASDTIRESWGPGGELVVTPFTWHVRFDVSPRRLDGDRDHRYELAYSKFQPASLRLALEAARANLIEAAALIPVLRHSRGLGQELVRQGPAGQYKILPDGLGGGIARVPVFPGINAHTLTDLSRLEAQLQELEGRAEELMAALRTLPRAKIETDEDDESDWVDPPDIGAPEDLYELEDLIEDGVIDALSGAQAAIHRTRLDEYYDAWRFETLRLTEVVFRLAEPERLHQILDDTRNLPLQSASKVEWPGRLLLEVRAPQPELGRSLAWDTVQWVALTARPPICGIVME